MDDQGQWADPEIMVQQETRNLKLETRNLKLELLEQRAQSNACISFVKS
jgi:hypothetical protein